MKFLLPCKYPTTTVILDDNVSFLESLELALPTDNRRFLFIKDPEQALQLINESSKKTYLNFFKQDGAGDLKLDYSIIKDLYLDTKRIHEISTVIIDYHMPEINGLTFCQQIKNSSCQKILLTANSDHNIAINAFNDGLVSSSNSLASLLLTD